MFRIGQGWDFHRFDNTGTEVILGGVTIPYDRGVLAHSDGDVLVHALMDALLGAMALEDIGCLFPDTDPVYKNADSTVLLKKVIKIMNEQKYKITNLDITLILEAPKVKPYREKILHSLANHLNLPLSSIGLKATTTEKMGDIGKKEGLACSVVVLLEKHQAEDKKVSEKSLRKNSPAYESLEVFTDGACFGGSGVGGWGAIINQGNEVHLKLSGGKRHGATEKQMELRAVVESLEHICKHLKPSQKVLVYTDSAYVIRGVGRLSSLNRGASSHGYAPQYCKDNYLLWEELSQLLLEVEAEFFWLHDRAQFKEQEQCKQLAEQEIQALRKKNR